MGSDPLVIEGGYLQDILAQPRALEDTLAGLEVPAAMVEAAARLKGGFFQRVVLTGMGSSRSALHPLRLELLQHGHTALLIETSELIHFAPEILENRTLVVAVSQSGRSAEMVRLLELKKPGCFTLGITNTPDSPLARGADAVVLSRAGEESTVACKTYLASLMCLEWVGALLTGRDPVRFKDELAQAAPAVAGYLAGWREWVRAAALELKDVRRLFVLGRGPSLATAETAGLIVKESAHFHAEGMSSAAFRHGPMEMVDGTLYALVFAGNPRTAGLNRQLAEDIGRAGGRAALAGEDAEAGLFRLPRVPSPARVMVEILPVEIMTLALAAMAGREAGKFERASKVTVTE